MSAMSLQDRAAGALVRAFIGDVLVLGRTYNLDELHADYDKWMTVAYGAPRLLVEGHTLDGALSGKLMARVNVSRRIRFTRTVGMTDTKNANPANIQWRAMKKIKLPFLPNL